MRRLQRAKERRAARQTLLEGPHLLQAALAAGVVPDVVFIAEGGTPPAVDTEVIPVSDSVLDAIAPTETPRGPIAVIAVPEPDPLLAERTVVLWDIATPGNVGTLIRTAAGLGWNVAYHGGADPWSPKVLRAGAGAHFAVSVSRVDDVGELAAAGLISVATVSAGGVPPGSIDPVQPIALLVGNEAHGLPPVVIDAATTAVTIPMVRAESLNSAIAGAILMYALGR